MKIGAIGKSITLKIMVIWLAIFLVSCFWFSTRAANSPIAIAVMPEARKQGEPILATFKLNNPTHELLMTDFQYYANNELVREGTVALAPNSSQSFQEVYASAVPMGQQVTFTVKTQSSAGEFEKMVATPAYPPTLWTSFISFATFSTSIMSSMTSMVYYEGNFGANLGFNIGLAISLILIALLIFLELFGVGRNAGAGKGALAFAKIRVRFSLLTWVLLIIFLGMLYTRMVIVLST